MYLCFRCVYTHHNTFKPASILTFNIYYACRGENNTTESPPVMSNDAEVTLGLCNIDFLSLIQISGFVHLFVFQIWGLRWQLQTKIFCFIRHFCFDNMFGLSAS